MDDLVERLRDAGYVLVSPGFRKLAHEAAARIEYLETSLADARRQALEEAAKVAARWDKFRWNGIDIDDARDVSAQIAQAIRAIADPLLDRQGDGKEGV